MRLIRRHDLSPRLEMTPLIDVIFLLLTFFIYSLVMMVRAEILPVTLTSVSTGEQGQDADVVAITIDKAGAFYLNRRVIQPEELNARLTEMAGAEAQPRLFLAMEVDDPDADPAQRVDRGPLLIGLIDRVRRAGIEDFNIVGEAE